MIDGAGSPGVFVKVAIPMVIPAIVLTFFSFIWFWNETTQLSCFREQLPDSPIRLQAFVESFISCIQPMISVQGAP